VKEQGLQLLKDVKAYQNETESLKTDKHQCHTEYVDCFLFLFSKNFRAKQLL